MSNDTISIVAKLTEYILNCKALANAIYNEILNDDDPDTTLPFSILLKQELGFLETFVDSIEPSAQLVKGGGPDEA